MKIQVSAYPYGARVLLKDSILPAGSWVLESLARMKTGLLLTEEAKAKPVAKTAVMENSMMRRCSEMYACRELYD
jgi:hypothetical protein